MGQLSIWSPVVVAEMNTPRIINRQKVYPLEQAFHSMEDLKVKIREHSVIKQGQVLEALIKFEVLCLLEDKSGDMHLLKQEDSLRDRIAFDEFDFEGHLEKETKLDFSGDIQKFLGEGNLNGRELEVMIILDYVVVATRQQVVRLSPEENMENIETAGQITDEVFREIELELARVEDENRQLRHKLFIYETNISSLKRGIKKAESNTACLNRESQQYAALIAQLQAGIREKDLMVEQYKHNYGIIKDNLSVVTGKAGENEDNLSLGSRVKRMFLNSL